MSKNIYTSSSRLAKVLGIDVTTVYRRARSKPAHRFQISKRLNKNTGKYEFKVPEDKIELYHELYNTK